MTHFSVTVPTFWCSETVLPMAPGDICTPFLSGKKVIVLKALKAGQSAKNPMLQKAGGQSWGVAGEVKDADEGHNQQCLSP